MNGKAERSGGRWFLLPALIGVFFALAPAAFAVSDTDGDGWTDDVDNCVHVFNVDQADADGDNIGDACDDCTDSDGDGVGDPSTDTSLCPVPTVEDNCVTVVNFDQLDIDGDGIGDACDQCPDDPTNTCTPEPCATPDGPDLGYAGQVLFDSPTAYWRLGESSGTVAEDAAGSNDGIYTGGITLGVPGAIAGDTDTAADFSADPKSRVPTTLAHAAFNQGSVRTFEGWACREENQGFDTFFSGDKRFNSPGMWTDHGDTDRIWFDPRREGGTGPRFWDGVMPPDGAWFYWALIFDDPANTAELFINGTSQGVRSVTEPYHSSPGNFQIGNYAQINEAWNGPLDEIAIFPGAASAGQICVHYAIGIGAEPVAYCFA